MRTVNIGIALIFVLFLASCGGTKEVIVPDHISAGSVQTDKGMPFYERGCYARALDHFYRANELYTAIGDSRGMAMSANNIGVVYRAMGEAAAAIPFFEDALRMYRSLGDQEDVRQTLSNLAAAQVDTGDYAAAGKNIDEALKIRIGRKPFVPAMTVKGILLAKQGDVKGAEAMLKEALDNIDRRNPAGAAAANYAMGELLLGTARYKEAVPYFEKALESDRKAGFYRGIADDLTALGRCSAGLQRRCRGRELLGAECPDLCPAGDGGKGPGDDGYAGRGGKALEPGYLAHPRPVDRWLKGDMTDNLCE